MNKFTFDSLQKQLELALKLGYEFWTCAKYYQDRNQSLPEKLIVLRIDIDFSVKKARKLGEIFQELGINGSFFVRLHAPEYNLFDFENYKVVKQLIKNGNELGYHSEIVDQASIWEEDAENCLHRDIAVLNNMFGIDVQGVASHGGMTGLNNLDFWKTKKAQDLGLSYEAYDDSESFGLFEKSFYISDSEWTRWKCYDKGRLLQGNHHSLGEHLSDSHKLVYLLIHSDTYYMSHFYE